MKILLIGASGLVGKKLIVQLKAGGHEISALARDPKSISFLPPENVFQWRHDQVPNERVFHGVHAVVNLAGENIAGKRWSDARKKSLVESRVRGTENIILGIERLKASARPETYISASGIGYYGDRGDEILSENSSAGRDFLAQLCVDWERAANQAESLGLRTIRMRMGIVLAHEGGAMSKMGPAILGSGDQWMSWIHIQDLLNFIEVALTDHSYSGVYNLVSPNPIQNVGFTKCLAKVRKYPVTVKVPEFLLKIGLGELANGILASQRAMPTRLKESDFRFQFADLENALKSIES